MATATWNSVLIAESDSTVVVEGNHYFPPGSLVMEHFAPSEKTSHCGWKGEASYYDIRVGDEVNRDAAWVYRDPKSAAAQIKGHVAFWRGVVVES